MPATLITATHEGTGKTAIALALAQLTTDRGFTVNYMKPKGTRVQSHLGKTIDRDPVFAKELLDLDVPLEVMEPIIYSSTFIQGVLRGHENVDTLQTTVVDRFNQLENDAEYVFVEGGNDLDSGAIVDLTDPQLAELLDLEVILVSRYTNPRDVDTTLAAARRCSNLKGVIFNAVADADMESLTTDVIPFFRDHNLNVLGTIPRSRELAGVSVEQLAEELGATVNADAGMSKLIERFTIGAMSGDAAASHLRRIRDAAVITGGDRADIQSVALEAPGVGCLVLTGGFEPSDAILGRARTNEVPILTVRADTRTTISRAEEIIQSGRASDPRSIERMRQLLVDHAAIDSILD